ncbi:CLUMA_CG012256, isoform A [Clunio marinus]|uniref:CLUMA_CG012256, isoform A n=1 Tax=Clunio marinus TaxID=568069 RepID=A0A1J1IIB5_9DIPT|nr:CLUMA_CG012256, isoform A [Clunio marinus]
MDEVHIDFLDKHYYLIVFSLTHFQLRDIETFFTKGNNSIHISNNKPNASRQEASLSRKKLTFVPSFNIVSSENAKHPSKATHNKTQAGKKRRRNKFFHSISSEWVVKYCCWYRPQQQQKQQQIDGEERIKVYITSDF